MLSLLARRFAAALVAAAAPAALLACGEDEVVIIPVPPRADGGDGVSPTPLPPPGATPPSGRQGALAIERPPPFVSESGTSQRIRIQLAIAPTANVVVTLASDRTSEGTVAPLSLTFTPSNWSEAQIATVTGVDDDLPDGDASFVVSFAVASADAAYDGITVDPITFTNLDDEFHGVVVGPPDNDAKTTEGGGEVTFSVVLRSQPTAEVTVSLASDDPAEGTILVGQELVFTPEDWNVAQTVVVAGEDDRVDDGDRTYHVAFGPITSDDPNYTSLVVPSVELQNVDDDTAAIEVSAISGTTDENGKTATFSVVLATRPTANVTVTLASNDAGEGTIDQTSLTFEPDTWDTPQVVTVTGVNDFVIDGDAAYGIAFGPSTSDDPQYAGKTPATVAVTNVDTTVSCVATCGFAGDDFEDGNTNGWNSVAGATLSAATAGGGASGTATYLRVEGATAHLEGAVGTINACRPRRFTVWMQPTSGAGAHNYVVLGDDLATGADAIAFIYADADTGFLRAVGAPSTSFYAYTPDVWIRLDLDLDWTARTVDISVDGVRQLSAFAFRAPDVDALSEIHFYNRSAPLGRYDQVSLSCSAP